MTHLTQGIILRQSPRGESDREYVIYTQAFGKIYAVARGAQKITSKLAPHLEPFLVSDLMLASSGKTKHIAAAQINKNYSAISAEFGKIMMVRYFLETVEALVKPEFSDISIFQITENLLSALAPSHDFPDDLCALNKSLFELLSHLGYCPIIRAKTQRQLLADLNRLAVDVAEKEIKSFVSLERLF